MRDKGFTLIEFVIMILIVGILSIVSVADLFTSQAAARLEAARFKLTGDLRYAQSLAVTQLSNYTVIFDSSSNSYSVYFYNTSSNATTLINNPLTQATYSFSYDTDSDLKGVDLVSASFGSPTTNQVRFDGWGTPGSNATANLTVNGNVTLSYGGATKIITVTKDTGMIF